MPNSMQKDLHIKRVSGTSRSFADCQAAAKVFAKPAIKYTATAFGVPLQHKVAEEKLVTIGAAHIIV